MAPCAEALRSSIFPRVPRPCPWPPWGRRRLAFLPDAAREIIAELITRHNHAWLIERLGSPTPAQARAAGLRRAT